MTPPRIIAEFCDFETMRRALNAGREFRDMSFKEMDAISNYPDGYFSKVLSPASQRRITVGSLGDAFGSIGMKCLMVVDEEAWNRIKDRIGKRANGLVRGGTVHFAVSSKFLQKIGKKGGKVRFSKMLASRRLASMGGKARAAALSPKQRSEIAKRAAQARWGKLTAPAEIGAR